MDSKPTVAKYLHGVALAKGIHVQEGREKATRAASKMKLSINKYVCLFLPSEVAPQSLHPLPSPEHRASAYCYP